MNAATPSPSGAHIHAPVPTRRSASSPQGRAARNSTLELLRIISMALIVLHHYGRHGVAVYPETGLSSASFFLQMLLPCGKAGVDCFILLSGYFLSTMEMSWKRLVSFYAEVWFYSVGLFILMTALSLDHFTWKGLLESGLPLTFDTYWFVSAYIVLFLASPYLNRLIIVLSCREHAYLIGLLLAVWCVWPTLLTQAPEMSALGWFSTLYLIAAFVRKYPQLLPTDRRFWAMVMVSCVLAFALIVLGLDLLLKAVGKRGDAAFLLHDMNRVPTFVMAVSLFLLFLNLPKTSSRFVNVLATSMLGVYLIHDHPYVRRYLWTRLFDDSRHLHFPEIALYAVGSAAVVFVVCVIIDQIRSLIAGFLFDRWYDSAYAVSEAWVKMKLRASEAWLAKRRALFR